ncbi:TAXI family TRAP transporter solute-binding subunit [Spiractinospora alimapuensis]|uniref:TAXI family TRAP transporter solute-binding subunit n=1 Tax=Spiractinospora alimapuensis TaxID=2820884 RepID=UPI001F1ABBB9|nr:TAXI family TRAP transporter solute-binding subunit [Spiractinospora alimapuensis]QVQ51008.1 TAXI family TRAP transporter solute-binding subunit [Spiractinospora alimapuensis]
MRKAWTNRKHRSVGALVAAAVLPATLVACGDDGGSAEPEENFTSSLQLGTGSVGGVYYPLGQEYANIFEDNIDEDGLQVSAVETGASVENLAMIARDELQLGIAQTNTAIEAANGEGDFDGAQVENAGFMGQLYPEAAQVITLESNGIDSVADLEGKTVAVGPPGGGTRQAAEAILSAHGIEEGDYTPLEEGFDDARSKLQDGNADASIEILGAPAASLQELQSTAGDVKLVPIEGDELQSIVEETNFEEYEITPEIYDFLDEPVSTISVFAAVYGSTNQISEDLGYEITKSLYENADAITMAQGELIDIEDALLGQGDVPFHPGSERYFEEQGLLD